MNAAADRPKVPGEKLRLFRVAVADPDRSVAEVGQAPADEPSRAAGAEQQRGSRFAGKGRRGRAKPASELDQRHDEPRTVEILSLQRPAGIAVGKVDRPQRE